MIGLPPSVKIYVAGSPCDMRWSFDRLASMVTEILKLDVYSGYLFLFIARRKDRISVFRCAVR
jgi:transposase